MTREEAITRIKDHIDIHRYHEQNAVKIFEALDMAIKSLEQPEIIRCENCEHWDGELRNGFYYFEHCSLTGRDRYSYDFCSRAERR